VKQSQELAQVQRGYREQVQAREQAEFIRDAYGVALEEARVEHYRKAQAYEEYWRGRARAYLARVEARYESGDGAGAQEEQL